MQHRSCLLAKCDNYIMNLIVSCHFALTNQVHCDATIAFPLLVAETFAKKSTKFVASNSL